MLTLDFRDRDSLYLSYMPFIKNGGLFIRTDKRYQLGDEITLSLSLYDNSCPTTLTGKVVWITPKAPQGSYTEGVGIQLNDIIVQQKIENLISELLV